MTVRAKRISRFEDKAKTAKYIVSSFSNVICLGGGHVKHH